MGTNCRGYLNLAAEGRFEEGYILSRDPNPVAAMCSYVCSAPCERACRRGDIDRQVIGKILVLPGETHVEIARRAAPAFAAAAARPDPRDKKIRITTLAD